MTDHRPARLSAALASVAAGVAVAVTSSIVGALGALGVLYGAWRGRRRAVTAGAFVVFVGVLLAGLRDAPAARVLVGTVAAVLAWDLGEQAINVGEQVGRAATTRRGELAHAAGSTLVGTLAASVGLATFGLAGGGRPVAALVLLLAGAVALTAALR